MATYNAHLMHGERGSEGSYDFDGPDDLLKKTPVRIVRHFMEHVEKSVLQSQHVDYELNAAKD